MLLIEDGFLVQSLKLIAVSCNLIVVRCDVETLETDILSILLLLAQFRLYGGLVDVEVVVIA